MQEYQEKHLMWQHLEPETRCVGHHVEVNALHVHSFRSGLMGLIARDKELTEWRVVGLHSSFVIVLCCHTACRCSARSSRRLESNQLTRKKTSCSACVPLAVHDSTAGLELQVKRCGDRLKQ